DLPSSDPILSLADEETVLPCRYQPGAGAQVVQVTWSKENSDGTKEQIITAHQINGQTAFGKWSRRVRFKNSDPTVDSALVIMSTEVSDEGTYLCHVSTFPSGNFEMGISITVWTVPISSLEPEILVEGQSYREAAYCRSVAHPTPRLSWDTDLNGQSTNHVSDNGVVTSRYSLHPLRNMNGMKLDCLVWHPTRAEPRRLTNKLVVHFPPNPEIVGYNEKWHVGFENAAVKCVSKGNPEPQMTWTREGGELPEGVTPHPNGTLAFRRPLSPSDAGTYRCVAKNDVGVASETVEIILTETAKIRISENMLMIIVGATAGGLLILMVVAIIVTTRHHKRRNKKTGEGADREELNTLSRQPSSRRMNSVSTDPRAQVEENIPLKEEG
uniref:Nectin cell adhesion molecule 4a n=1 Tax=Tetraodon nigroviridis TaxID=99883 RepID=H3CDX2_TETNG